MSLTNSPKLDNANLILQGPEIRDFEPIALFYADAPRAAGFGGSLKRDDAWRWFASNIGHWHIHGYGYFTIEKEEFPNLNKDKSLRIIFVKNDNFIDFGTPLDYKKLNSKYKG